jgi:hypothetical protein
MDQEQIWLDCGLDDKRDMQEDKTPAYCWIESVILKTSVHLRLTN